MAFGAQDYQLDPEKVYEMEPEHPQMAETVIDVLAMPAESHDVQ